MPGRTRPILYLLFTVSGFTGLIYESLWTHYLKLFLGHAAYAQALVLAIFMGGLAIGSWVCSRYSGGWKNLLLGYAVTEGAVGLFAIAFHGMFTHAVGFSYATVLPGLGAPLAANVFKWALSALLILPQTVLLGMTFPLMVSAFLRAFPQTPGRSIALLYFTNSIGAAVGVLVSGFVLVAWLGLPGTMRLAGSVNLLLAVVVWRLARPAAPVAPPALTVVAGPARWYRRLLFVSAATGAASFVYEIAWIRMLSLVMGSSTHAFEVMLSAFIFGLAFGGLWVQRRIDALPDPRRTLAIVQVAMGLLALGTLPFYEQSFGVMRWLIASLPKTDGGYVLFNLSSNAIALAVMLPATFCAGMTLPLITTSMLKDGSGERSVGAVYAVNTVGAIAGVFFAIHVGMPLLGLKGLLIAGASLDLSIGVLLAWSLWAAAPQRRRATALTALAVGGVLAAGLLVRIDPYLMASGVYRTGSLIDPGTHSLLFHRDGKTATISVDEHGRRQRSVRTNGKIDSTVNLGPPDATEADEPTMILAGALPLAYHPGAHLAANIGLGTGLTSHVLLCSPQLERVETIEIEQEMIEGARLLSERVGSVFTDPRSRLRVDDAKTFFSVHDARYDVIVSEPSNPWVSGVAGLFSGEFYDLVTRYLTDDGIFVQWVQLYEIDEDLVASVLKALAPRFSDYDVYAGNYADLLIVARKTGTLGRPSFEPLRAPRLAAELARVGIRSSQELALRRLGGKQLFQPLLDRSPFPANSDYYPVLDERAAKTRFLRLDAMDLLGLTSEPLPIADLIGRSGLDDGTTAVTPFRFLLRTHRTWAAMGYRDFLLFGRFDPAYEAIVAEGRDTTARLLQEYAEGKANVERLAQLFSSTGPTGDPNRRVYLFNGAKSTVPYLTAPDAAAIWRRLESEPGARTLSPVERDYVDLFKGIGARDARAISVAGARILGEERDITPARLRYVLAATMLGDISSGNPVEAWRRWTVHGGRLAPGETTLLFRVLLAHSQPG